MDWCTATIVCKAGDVPTYCWKHDRYVGTAPSLIIQATRKANITEIFVVVKFLIKTKGWQRTINDFTFTGRMLKPAARRKASLTIGDKIVSLHFHGSV